MMRSRNNGVLYHMWIALGNKLRNSVGPIKHSYILSRNTACTDQREKPTWVGIHKAKSNSCSIGFYKFICTVASENYRIGPFDKEIQ
jgi:hypothetical protein